jgi:hypothetical protein
MLGANDPKNLNDIIKSVKELYRGIQDINHTTRLRFANGRPILWSSYSHIARYKKGVRLQTAKIKKAISRDYPDIDLFYTKDDAYAFSVLHSSLPVFSIDKSNKVSKKIYAVCGYNRWWKEYSKQASLNRYAYEVVLPDVPCHLYLDIEVSLNSNKQSHQYFRNLVDELLTELKVFCKARYIAPKDIIDNARTVILDSSKPVKFSKHVIFKLSGGMFKNNYHCGAIMRQFNTYIINKYGKPTDNKFYVNADSNSKDDNYDKSSFIIDLGVYTKGRDFRLLGSRKRVSKEQRWLWIEHKQDVLQHDDFFDSLIQYQSPNETLDFLVCNVPDILNEGIPMSSSLRSISPERKGTIITANVKSGTITSYSPNRYSKKRKINPPSQKLLLSVCEYIHTRYNISVTSISIRRTTIIFNTNVKSCLIKRHITKDDSATHAKNSIFLILYVIDASLKQSCFNNSWCMDQSSQRHRTYDLGKISDEVVCEGLRNYCQINGWIFKYPFEETGKWLGNDDSE